MHLPSIDAAGDAWSRSEWFRGDLSAWQRIVTPIAEHVQSVMSSMPLRVSSRPSWPRCSRGHAAGDARHDGALMGMARQLGSAMFGMQMGQALAALAGEVVGVSDIGIPLTSDARPALLPRNVAAFGDGLDVPAQDVRLYLALRECAHQRLFAHVPWLAPRLEGAIDAYARGIRMDPERMNEAMQGIDPSALQDPERLRELMGSDLFALSESEEQQAALRRLETLLALIEGWVDDVVTAACASTLPSADRLGEAIRRRRASGGPAERTFASLVGLEMRPRALREASSLWRQLREERGIDGRDALWAHPDLLPTADDLTDPSAFLAGDPLAGSTSEMTSANRGRPGTNAPMTTTPDPPMTARSRRAGGAAHSDALRVLARWQPPSASQEALRRDYLEFLDAHPDATRRSHRHGHLTGSALVVDPSREAVLLTLHPLVGRWLQLGGHIEDDDASLARHRTT